ncbi:MAG TPA: MoaD/ThiS family protein [Actinomycetota bacterium]
MPIYVTIPTILRSHTGGESTVEADGGTLDEVLTSLEKRYPGITRNLRDGDGLRRFVNVYVNEDDARLSGALQAPVAEGAIVSIVPAVAGG